MLGAHAHPIPAAALVWLYTVPETDPSFASLCRSVPAAFFAAINAEPCLDRDWFCEACTVISRFVPTLAEPHSAPAYAVQTKSPTWSPDELPRVLRLCDANNGHPRTASLLLYYLTLGEIERTMSAVSCHWDSACDGYSRLSGILPLYANECTYSVTGDRFLHVCLRMHVPSWCTMLSTGGCYAELASLLGPSVNNVIRPFVDIDVHSELQRRDANSDDVVLFVIVCTLIAEICGDKALRLRYNRDVLFATDVPCPFVLCDFPVAGILTDAYGFTDGRTLVVCNGSFVSGGVSMWLSALGKRAPTISAFLNGTADATNPLCKYAA